MKRTRAEMKEQAKSALRMNYWKIVLVSLLVLLLAGGGSSSVGSAGRSLVNFSNDNYGDDYEYYADVEPDDAYADTASARETAYYYEESGEYFHHGILDDALGLSDGWLSVTGFFESAFIWVAAAVILVILAVVIALDVFIFAPLRVGTKRFFLVSQKEKAGLGELAWAFDQNYRHTVKTMFFRDVKLVLWTLLFIIPGIVKSYEYAAVPYLLAECPEMDSREVFAASRDLMDGNKWRAFVLDLSFLLWELASACTLGLLGIFYVNPYRNLTAAAFYQTVCWEKSAGQSSFQWQEENN